MAHFYTSSNIWVTCIQRGSFIFCSTLYNDTEFCRSVFVRKRTLAALLLLVLSDVDFFDRQESRGTFMRLIKRYVVFVVVITAVLIRADGCSCDVD